MGLETGTYISDLVVTNPTSTDPKSQGDDHLRLVKATLKNTFPNITGAMTVSHTVLNYVATLTSNVQDQINTKGAIAGQVWGNGTHDFTAGIIRVLTQSPNDNSTKSASTAYVDAADALKGTIAGQVWSGTHDFTGATLTASTPALGDNDTSVATTAFAMTMQSPAFSGTPTVPTAPTGTNTTQIATTAFVIAQAFNAVLPNQSGNAGKFITTDGTNAGWAQLPAGAILYTATNFGGL